MLDSQLLIPQHLGIIMDGNGRWATKRGLPRHIGHYYGRKTLMKLTKESINLNIKFLSVYAFSTENWGRPMKEVDLIFNFNHNEGLNNMFELQEYGTKVIFISRYNTRLSDNLQASITKIHNNNKTSYKMILFVHIDYGGRVEIVDTTKKIAKLVLEKSITIDDIDENLFSQYLYYPDMPNVDLLIRTAGEKRISNFLLWQTAYTELIFYDKFWPSMTKKDIYNAIIEYSKRERRYGEI